MGRDIREQLTKYLTDAHAIEEQSLAQMRAAPDIAGEAGLERAFREHLDETESHQTRVRRLLEAREARPSRVKDAVMWAGGKAFVLWGRLQPDTPGKLATHALSYEALEWGTFFLGHPDTAGKLAGFAYAFEHLEIGGYEHLRRVAERAGDPETARTVEGILAEERRAADRLADAFDEAVSAALEATGAS
jgi:ferritin-like metal-binding protein YciE